MQDFVKNEIKALHEENHIFFEGCFTFGCMIIAATFMCIGIATVLFSIIEYCG